MQKALPITLWLGIATAIFGISQGEAQKVTASYPLRVLVVTGGHDFEREPFFEMFRSFEGITYEEVQHPQAHARLTPEASTSYDVIVLYDMWQPISDEHQRAFVKLLQQGKGLVALHHSLASYQTWDEYRHIIGGRWHTQKGHDHYAYENPHYRRLVLQAIRWVAGR